MVFITAEIGINHNGNIDITKKLIDMAVRTGCDAVKFQKRSVDKYTLRKFLILRGIVRGVQLQENKNLA